MLAPSRPSQVVPILPIQATSAPAHQLFASVRAVEFGPMNTPRHPTSRAELRALQRSTTQAWTNFGEPAALARCQEHMRTVGA